MTFAPIESETPPARSPLVPMSEPTPGGRVETIGQYRSAAGVATTLEEEFVAGEGNDVPEQANERPAEPGPLVGTPLTGIRILLIEDDVDLAEVLSMVLSMEGHEVLIASDGARALELFAQMVPEVVLCDVFLPGIGGYELAARMRECSQIPPPLMIALTGLAGTENRARSLAAGFDHHVVKPFDPAALLRLIAAALPVSAPSVFLTMSKS